MIKIGIQEVSLDETELKLCSNQFESFPQEIFQLANLTKLSLRHYKLESLPPEIGKLTNLTVLSLHGNKLSNLPDDINFLYNNLQTLCLGENKFKKYPLYVGH